ncbi:CRISPR-associated endonuclease Cas1 [Elysia marginata]|uniref:CRISPR-associated endonuclease Cas1 n=1 Tax=Elysia marginata TaxID=1093978 RepID=A0AAV4JVW4_9GAST|nr:CRISPR-associated endonuclease Cas1 [Elysia marginata]
MIKRTLYFGNEAYLSTQKEQLLIRFPDRDKEVIKLPIEDIGIVVADHYRLTFTQSLVSKLLASNVAFITCNASHHPTGMMLNLDGNNIQSERFRVQIDASVPLKKNLWQQTIKSKILNQAWLLESMGIISKKMKRWANSVGSGDTDNYEGRAAVYYWKEIFSPHIENFKRGQFGAFPNNLLNYGYAVLRAIIARALVGSGLLPTLGIHHHNKYNAYCLADDIMEPYRPFVDRVALNILKKHGHIEDLDTDIKRELLQIPVMDITINGKNSPLMLAAGHTTASLYECFAGNTRKIKYPSFQ